MAQKVLIDQNTGIITIVGGQAPTQDGQLSFVNGVWAMREGGVVKNVPATSQLLPASPAIPPSSCGVMRPQRGRYQQVRAAPSSSLVVPSFRPWA
jgi:hypothetical protein